MKHIDRKLFVDPKKNNKLVLGFEHVLEENAEWIDTKLFVMIPRKIMTLVGMQVLQVKDKDHMFFSSYQKLTFIKTRL